MSTEVTPESLRTHATWMNDRGAKESHMALTRWADDLEREQRPLPTVPGWYPSIVVERGGESCTGALLTDNDMWVTSPGTGECHTHFLNDRHVTIRWAEQDGTTPGQTLHEAEPDNGMTWGQTGRTVRDLYERIAAAVLVAHGSPALTPVGEHPEPGTRGLLPVVALSTGAWQSTAEWLPSGRYQGHNQDILADPRPDGAHE